MMNGVTEGIGRVLGYIRSKYCRDYEHGNSTIHRRIKRWAKHDGMVWRRSPMHIVLKRGCELPRWSERRQLAGTQGVGVAGLEGGERGDIFQKEPPVEASRLYTHHQEWVQQHYVKTGHEALIEFTKALSLTSSMNHLTTLRLHPWPLIVADEDATAELRVKTVKYNLSKVEATHRALAKGKEGVLRQAGQMDYSMITKRLRTKENRP
ncbi:hypothetical protein JB92DRAFT_2827338 [Gautieria morchelliformis]|nr:hypothetical protein JB92DRAFT_2827338 [Gautieria morchelliformis]